MPVEPVLFPLVLVTLTVPPSLEESVVDWLLEFGEQPGFTSQLAYGHSSHLEGLNPIEQVFGRRKQVRFQLHIPHAELSGFLDRLRSDFAGAGLHYWVTPVLEAGHV